MTQHIVLSRANGSVAIMVHVGPPTPEAIAAELAKMADQFVSYRLIDAAELPTSREFRAAWMDGGSGPVTHHMPTAREIHKARLRAERAPLLAELDAQYQRADEANDGPTKRRIAEMKHRLRDVTDDPRIRAAESVEALAAVKIQRDTP